MKQFLKIMPFVLLVLILMLIGEKQVFAQQSTTGPVRPEGVDKGIKNINPESATLISGVPSYLWRYGCGPTALGMVIGYYDTHGFPDLIPGNASVQNSNVNNAIANDEHYNDYSLPLDYYPNLLQDKSELGGAHVSNCIADFMNTSWSSRNNFWGWSWSSDIGPAFEQYIQMRNDEYIINTNFVWFNSFSWSKYINEIDHNRPVVLLVDSDGNGYTDHFVTGIGYDEDNMLYAIYDTWDQSIHWYQWRGLSNNYSWGIYGFNILKVQQNLSADFIAGATTIPMGENIQFFDNSTGNPESFQWTFEGGNPATSTSENPLITYNSYGTFDVSLTVTSGATTSTVTKEDYITVLPETQTIIIPPGWSGLSGYLIPENTDLTIVFQNVINNMIILENSNGFFYPESGTNTIGEWNTFEGYSIKTNTGITLEIDGAMPVSKEIALATGWNLIPVLHRNNISVSGLFENMQNTLIIVKEVAGNKIYWPSKNIYTLEWLEPGKAYFVKTTADGSIVFP